MENNRIALSRSVTPTTSPLLPTMPRSLLIRSAKSLTNVQLQPSSSSPQLASFRMAHNPLVRRESPPCLSSVATRPAVIGPLLSQLSTRPVPSARISLAHSSRRSPSGPRQFLPTQIMSPARFKESYCVLPSARLALLPTDITQPSTSTASAESEKFNQAEYEVPEQNRAIISKLINEKHGLSVEYAERDNLQQQVKTEFFASRDQLLKNAETHLPGIAATKTRPTIPELTINDSPRSWIKKIYKNNDGMVMGEFHGDSGSKKFLIKNMSLLKKQGVRTLYLEHLLSDLHHNELESYFSPKMKKTPSGLKNYLEGLNRGFNIRSKYNFLTLIESAKANGIRVMAIDATASYHTDRDNSHKNCRIHMMNYYAQGVINNHQKITQSKWIALVGNQHANTFENIPGLAELTNGIGVRVKETPRKTAVIQPDNGEISLSASSNGPIMTYNFIRSDFVLSTPQTKDIRITLSANDIEKRLKTGNFTIDTERSMLKHRSRDGSIVETPLNRDPDGNWFITKPDWKKINNKPYGLIQDLIKDLEETMHMKLVYGL